MQYWREHAVPVVRRRTGSRASKLRLRDHDPDELAFYSTATADIEYAFPFGVSELEGIAHRGDYDLNQHMKFTRQGPELLRRGALGARQGRAGDDGVQAVPGEEQGQGEAGLSLQYVPHVIEPSAGADRATLAFLCEAYTEDEMGGETRTVLKFHPRLAPIKAAVFPLVKKDGMPEKAEAIYRDLKRQFNVFFDEKGAIGRRYRRQDEAGTPFGITVDGQTLQDDTVTFRDRESAGSGGCRRRAWCRRCGTCSKGRRSRLTGLIRVR